MKKSIKLIEFVGAAVAVFLLTLFMANNPSITGFVTTETFVQKLNFEVTESQLIGIESISNSPLQITSLRLSGEVIGNGLAEIYLNEGRQKKIIYSNLQKKKKGMLGITGHVTGAVRVYEKAGLRGELVRPEGYQTKQEVFKDACIETCTLEGLKGTFYDIEIWVQPGTRVKITELKYNIIE